MPENEAKVWSVTDLTRIIKDLLEQSLQPLWLSGEVSNLTIHRSGHVYLTLKDEHCQVQAVYFRGANHAREMQLAEGMEVEAFCRVTVYEARGNYQVIIQQLRPKGLGDLQRQFEELKEKLREEGLFEAERKRPIPPLPEVVGVVSSPTGAAIRDFLNVIGRRFPNMHVRLYPARVQGDAAAREVAAGIEYFNRTRSCSVIVVTRGGGSLEDLWAFNDEALARTIAASELPVISAVGHEVDFTIADFVADLRAPTPSAAAELVVGRRAEYLDRLDNLQRRLVGVLRLRLTSLRGRVDRLVQHYVFREPLSLVRQYQQRVDHATLQMGHTLQRRLERVRSRLDRHGTQLRLLDPHNVLGRGYAILIDKRTRAAVRRPADVTAGAPLRGVLADGEIDLRVE